MSALEDSRACDCGHAEKHHTAYAGGRLTGCRQPDCYCLGLLAGREPNAVAALADRLAEAVDGFTPYERDSDASGRPPGFYLRDGSGQVFQVTVTAFTCRVCGEVLSQARSALGLTLCSGACHRAATGASGDSAAVEQ